MLAEAIIFDRLLGSTHAVAVIDSLGGWQGNDAGFARRALARAVEKAKADSGQVSNAGKVS